MGDKTLQICAGKALDSPLRGHTGWVCCLAYSPDGQRIVSCSVDLTVRILDWMTGEVIGAPLQGHTNSVYCVAWSPDGTRIVSGSIHKTIRILNSRTGKEIGSPLKGHTDHIWCVVVSPDGRRIVSGSNDKMVRMWDVETGKAIGLPLQRHTSYVSGVAFSRDRMLIVSSSGDRTTKVWDAKTGEAMVTCSCTRQFYSLCGDLARRKSDLVELKGQTVKLWDSTTVEALSIPKPSQFTIKIDDDPSVSANMTDAAAQCKQGELDTAMRKFDLAVAGSSSSPKSIPSACSVLFIELGARKRASHGRTISFKFE